MKRLIHFIFVVLMACSESKNNSHTVEDKNSDKNSEHSCALILTEEEKKLFVINIDKNWEKFGENQITNCSDEKNKFLALMSATVFATFKSIDIKNVNEHKGYSHWVLNMSDLDYCKPKNITIQSLTEILSCR